MSAFQISGFTHVLVSKFNPEEVFIAVEFNPQGLEYQQTFCRDVVVATKELVENKFNCFPKPEFKPGVDAVILSKNSGHSLLRAGKDFFAMKIGSKIGYALDKNYVEANYQIVDVERGLNFVSDSILYRVVKGDYCLEAEMFSQPYQKEATWISSYIPFHNLFTYSNKTKLVGKVYNVAYQAKVYEYDISEEIVTASDEFTQVLDYFESCVREDEMSGAQDPDDVPEIERALENARHLCFEFMRRDMESRIESIKSSMIKDYKSTITAESL